MAQDINIGQLAETLNDKADIDLNNTGVDEADRPINNYQVNNVYSYGMSQYYKGTMNNNAWLKSAGQWNDGTVYTGMYNWLLEQRNAGIKPVYPFFVVDTTTLAFYADNPTLSVGDTLYGYNPARAYGTVTAVEGNTITLNNNLDGTSGSVNTTSAAVENIYICDPSKLVVITKEELDSWYAPSNIINDYDFVVNTTDQTFRLPLLNGEENLVDYNKPTSFKTKTNFTAPANGIIYASVNGYSGQTYSYYWTINDGEKQYFGGNQSGTFLMTIKVKREDVFYIVGYTVEADRLYFYPYIADGNLYYYVGDTLQNAQLINVARIEESVVNKTNKVQAAEASMPSGKYTDLTLGASGTQYAAPANGWFWFSKIAGTNMYGVSIENERNGMIIGSDAGAPGSGNAVMPVLAGDNVVVEYSATGKTLGFRFIYAQGDQ